MSLKMPVYAEDLTPAFLTGLVADMYPGVAVEAVDVVQVRNYGDADPEFSVSTSAQVRLKVTYGGTGHESLPTELLAKMSFPERIGAANPELDPFFRNEVAFYRHIRPGLDIDAPLGMGGYFDPASRRYILLMEDLTPRKPHINTMMDRGNVAGVEAAMDTFAKLHASHWNNPRFRTDLAWVPDLVESEIESLFDGIIPAHIHKEIERERFKREFAEELGLTEYQMYAGIKAVKRHQATLPQTFLHGDAHFNNSYRLPDGAVGLYDWQISAKGFLTHDICYYIQTALPVEMRRKHERELLAFYRSRLCSHGVADAPSDETIWYEYRLSLLYGFYYGWMTAPRENYSWEVIVIGNHRTKVACMDHDVWSLIKKLG